MSPSRDYSLITSSTSPADFVNRCKDRLFPPITNKLTKRREQGRPLHRTTSTSTPTPPTTAHLLPKMLRSRCICSIKRLPEVTATDPSGTTSMILRRGLSTNDELYASTPLENRATWQQTLLTNIAIPVEQTAPTALLPPKEPTIRLVYEDEEEESLFEGSEAEDGNSGEDLAIEDESATEIESVRSSSSDLTLKNREIESNGVNSSGSVLAADPDLWREKKTCQLDGLEREAIPWSYGIQFNNLIAFEKHVRSVTVWGQMTTTWIAIPMER